MSSALAEGSVGVAIVMHIATGNGGIGNMTGAIVSSGENSGKGAAGDLQILQRKRNDCRTSGAVKAGRDDVVVGYRLVNQRRSTSAYDRDIGIRRRAGAADLEVEEVYGPGGRGRIWICN